jgi:hypothetical protein
MPPSLPASDGPRVGYTYRDRGGDSLRVVALVYESMAKQRINSVVVEFADGSARRMDILEWQRINAAPQIPRVTRRE